MDAHMKPRLIKLKEIPGWMCIDWLITGVGGTPKQAYEDYLAMYLRS
jgi:hypothetical protein